MKKPVVAINNLATTFIGSVILCACIFEPKYQSEEEKIRLYWLYEKIGKKPKKYFNSVEDTWNIQKILEAFNIERTWDWACCMVTSDRNCLLTPYATEEDKIIPLPIRTDCLAGYTLKHAVKIQLIKWND